MQKAIIDKFKLKELNTPHGKVYPFRLTMVGSARDEFELKHKIGDFIRDLMDYQNFIKEHEKND